MDATASTRSLKFSIVIPVWDRTELLRQCLTSALTQTIDEYEVIVVTDGSPPPTLEVIKWFSGHPKLRVFQYTTQSGTACRGRNRGIIEARGEYVVFLDSDDIALPNRLSEMAELLRIAGDNAPYILSGRARYIGDGQRQVEGIVLNETTSSRQLVSYERLRVANSLVMSAVAIHRDSLLRYGGFRPELAYREDHELYLRLMYNGVKIRQTDELVTLYRLHGENAELHLQQHDAEIVKQLDALHKAPFMNWGVCADDGANGSLHSAMSFNVSTDAARPTIELEVPVPWLDHPIVGDAHRIYLANLMSILSEANATVSLRPLGFGKDFEPRSTTKAALISHHSIGDAKNVWRVKESPIPYYFSFDRNGYSGWAEFANQKQVLSLASRIDSAAVKSIIQSVRSETVGRNESKYPQSVVSDPNIPQNCIFFPLQIMGDTVMKLCRVDYVSAIRLAAELAREYEIPLLIKRHPYCDSPDIEDLINDLVRSNPYAYKTDASVHQCIAHADMVLCCNSGVGFEALLHGKPVFSLGHSDYAAATDRIDDLNDLKRVFLRDVTITDVQRECFVAYFLSEYCFDVRNREQLMKKIREKVIAYAG